MLAVMSNVIIVQMDKFSTLTRGKDRSKDRDRNANRKTLVDDVADAQQMQQYQQMINRLPEDQINIRFEQILVKITQHSRLSTSFQRRLLMIQINIEIIDCRHEELVSFYVAYLEKDPDYYIQLIFGIWHGITKYSQIHSDIVSNHLANYLVKMTLFVYYWVMPRYLT